MMPAFFSAGLAYSLAVVFLVICGSPGNLPFPTGTRDPQRSIAYIQAEGEVRAVRLEDGRPVWTERNPGHPVAILNGMVVVQHQLNGRAFQIDLLHTASGKPVISSEPIRFTDSRSTAEIAYVSAEP